MITISTDLSTLSNAQRKAVAAFISAFPGNPHPEDAAEVVPDNNDEVAVMLQPCSVYVEPDDDPEAAFSPVAPAAGDDRLDKNGLPWDERIHASSKAKTADGSWRMKRNVDPALVTHVEGELKALMAIPAPPTPAVPAAEVSTTMLSPASSEPLAAVPVATPPPPPPAPVDDRQAFVSLIGMASGAIAAKKLTQEELQAAVVAAGVPSLPMLSNRLDLVPAVRATIDAMVAGR